MFFFSWTKSQVRARSHPNVLSIITLLNNMYHMKSNTKLEGVELSTALSYADRFRVRHPGVQWDFLPPHIDGMSFPCIDLLSFIDVILNVLISGGAIERWEDPAFRACYADILNGNWKKHDPYELEGRLNAKTSLYGRPNQVWISSGQFMHASNIGFIILCQFSLVCLERSRDGSLWGNLLFLTFNGNLKDQISNLFTVKQRQRRERSKSSRISFSRTHTSFCGLSSNWKIPLHQMMCMMLETGNWVGRSYSYSLNSSRLTMLCPRYSLDVTTPEFPGIRVSPEKGFYGPRPSPDLHPHLNLEQTMISVPKVFPGDMVFWHCVSITVRYSLYYNWHLGRTGHDSFRGRRAYWQRRLGG